MAGVLRLPSGRLVRGRGLRRPSRQGRSPPSRYICWAGNRLASRGSLAGSAGQISGCHPTALLPPARCVRHGRAALDHLACQLAKLEGPSACKHTQFPIIDSSFDKRGQPKIPSIRGVTNKHVIDALIAVQPYTAVEKYGHPLEETVLHILRTLVNIDKHRLLLVTMHALHPDEAWWGIPEGREPPDFRFELGALEDHAPVAWFDFGDSEPYPGFDPHLSLTVRLRGHGGLAWLPLLELTRVLGGEIEEMIGQHFAPFFGDGVRHDMLRGWRNLG
jgi:hypothetical protein